MPIRHYKRTWKCGMCGFINPGRNYAKCKQCGAVKGIGS